MVCPNTFMKGPFIVWDEAMCGSSVVLLSQAPQKLQVGLLLEFSAFTGHHIPLHSFILLLILPSIQPVFTDHKLYEALGPR